MKSNHTDGRSDKPFASISLDVDNLWSYMKTFGDPGWVDRPTYLDVFVPVALDLLESLRLKITFFIVGVDAADGRNAVSLQSLTRSGHEVGNHSFEHEPWLHLYTPEAVRQELWKADQAISAVTGQRPVGFRGPGFSWSVEVLETLVELGYRFDASTFPTYLGPLARAYYFRTSKLTAAERAQRSALFGGFREGLRPIKPYIWQLPTGARLLEIPVTTMPVLKMPFHLSYLIYLGRYSVGLMMAYFRSALAMCRMLKVAPSFLLHPLDLLGSDQVPTLKFFPGMDIKGEFKRHLCTKVLRELGQHYELVPMSTHADALMTTDTLALRHPVTPDA